MKLTLHAPYVPIKLILLLFAAAFLSACKINGSVSLDGIGASGITVILESSATRRSTTTDTNGRYTFNDVSDGNYTVSIQAPGAYSGTATVSVAKQGDVNNVNFAMLSETIRTTDNGNVIGFTEDNNIHTWKGIPFAKPPINDLRWQAPTPAAPWGENPYLALKSKAGCMEPIGELVPGQNDTSATVKGTEDCLYLDIQAPAFSSENIPTGNARLPVLVWIYGGGNVVLFKDGQNGKNLVKDHDMIVVTFNYRVGHMGWFSHPALANGNPLDDSGNYGTLDIIRVLNWVQDNIGNFGGDPNNVTIGGLSAGSFNVYSMMLSPLADGLFHKAISQSGYITTYDMATVQNYEEDGGYFNSSREVMNNLLIQDGSAVDRLSAKALQDSMSNIEIKDYLYSKTAAEVLAAGRGPNLQPHDSTLAEPGYFSVVSKFRDGVVLPTGDPLSLFQDDSSYNAVPFLVGATRDESKPFVAFDPEFVHLLAGLPIASKDRNYYNLFNRYKGDYFRIKGVDSVARALTQNPDQPDVFAYQFDWDNSPTIIIADLPHLIGAAHALDAPFSFNITDEPGDDFFSTYFFTDQNAADRRELATSMSSYWAEFIHTGNPGSGRQSSESIAWLPWTDTPNENNLMILDGLEDAGIRMTHSLLTMEDLKLRLITDGTFPSQQKHCQMYEELFNRTAYWNTEEYLTLGDNGCAALNSPQ